MSLYPEPDNITNISAGVDHVNTITGGIFGLGIPLSVLAIVIIVGALMKSRMSVTFMVGFSLFTIISSLLAWGDWINPVLVIIGAILTGLCVLWVRLEKG
jgi:hypothetical protein